MDQIVAMRAFVRVAQAQSFQKAAKLEGLTQSAVSKRVAALEDHLGVQLLRRNQRNVTLTTLGQAHYDDCVRLLAELDAAETRIRTDAQTPAGVVRLSMSPVLSRLIVAPLIVEFAQQYPRIEVVSFLTEAHVDIVGQGIDLALRARHLEDSALVVRRLSSNPLMLAAAPAYLKSAPRLDVPEDLPKHRSLTFNRMKTLHSWRFTQGRRVREVMIQGQLTADQGDTLVEYAIAGAGIVLMPEWVMSEHLANGRLVRVLPDWSPPSIPLQLVMASGSNVPLRVRLLSDFIRRTIRQRGLLPR
ncbi:MAG: LysR family transcriptional regulator [Ruegeria sp.]